MALDDSDFQLHSGHTLLKSRHHLKVKVGPCPISARGFSLYPTVGSSTPVHPPRQDPEEFLPPSYLQNQRPQNSVYVYILLFSPTQTLKTSPQEGHLRDIICKTFLVKFTWFSSFRHSNVFRCISGI